MQRIQSWFDQLTINRQSRRRRRRNTSRVNDACEDERRQSQTQQRKTSPRQYRHHSQTTIRPPVTLNNFNFPPPPPTSNMFDVNSMPRRNKIRTNPWISSTSPSDSSKLWGSMCRSGLDSSAGSRVLPASLCVASPNTSMCSSGYASHDSSPDTSMVWSNEWLQHKMRNNGEMQQKFHKTTYIDEDDDGIYDDDNIYHELVIGSSTKLSDSSCSLNNYIPNGHTNCLTPSPKHERVDSPIYAEPWTSSRGPIDLINCNYRPISPVYAQPYAPRRQIREFTDDELARDEFLHDLDQQILELQLRSEELREMVERARHQPRKEYVSIPKMECTFELAI